MSSPDPQVRAARNRSTPTPPRGPVVAVTGAASGVGDLLTRRLAASDEIKQVVAIDERRGEVSEAQWHILDVRDPAIAEKLRGADVVVHLALDLDLERDAAARTAYNVRGTQTVLTAAAAAGVHRVVLCTSAMVYGALPDNDIPLSEDAELRATAEATGVGDLLEIERLGRRAPRAHPGLNVTVVRPAVLVGGTDTALTRYFESPRLLVVAGFPAHLAVLPRRRPGQRPGVRGAGEGRRRVRGRLRRLARTGGDRGAERHPPHGAALRRRPRRRRPAAPDRPHPVPGR